jgi:hypothetical protein
MHLATANTMAREKIKPTLCFSLSSAGRHRRNWAAGITARFGAGLATELMTSWPMMLSLPQSCSSPHSHGADVPGPARSAVDYRLHVFILSRSRRA